MLEIVGAKAMRVGLGDNPTNSKQGEVLTVFHNFVEK